MFDLKGALKFRNPCKMEHWRGGKLLQSQLFYNDITNAGKNALLGIMFFDVTQIASTSWFMGLIDNSGFSALAAADTMASHSGWTEFVAYSGGARPVWGQGAASGQSITNASAITFTMTGAGAIYGIFINSVATLSGTLGTLWATAPLSGSPVSVASSDQLKMTYTVSC